MWMPLCYFPVLTWGQLGFLSSFSPGDIARDHVVPSPQGKNWPAIALYCESALFFTFVSKLLAEKEGIWLRVYRAVSLSFSYLLACLFLFFWFLFFAHSTSGFHDLPASVLLANDTKWVKSDKSIVLRNVHPVEVR